MTTILIGILSSVVAEIVVALNKRLKGTVLQGDAAFLLAFGIAIIGAFFTQAVNHGISVATFTNWASLTQTFTGVFTISQLYFLFITQKLHLDIRPTTNSVNVLTQTQSTANNIANIEKV